MEREHVGVLAGEDFVAGLDDELELLIGEPAIRVVREGGSFFEDRVGGDHLAGDEVRTDAEVFEGSLGLSTPEFFGGNFHLTKAVSFFAGNCHLVEVLDYPICLSKHKAIYCEKIMEFTPSLTNLRQKSKIVFSFHPANSNGMTPETFVKKWSVVALTERSATQQHFLDLCELMAHPAPARGV